MALIATLLSLPRDFGMWKTRLRLLIEPSTPSKSKTLTSCKETKHVKNDKKEEQEYYYLPNSFKRLENSATDKLWRSYRFEGIDVVHVLAIPIHPVRDSDRANLLHEIVPVIGACRALQAIETARIRVC